MTNTRARELIDSGYRMPAPDGTPDEVSTSKATVNDARYKVSRIVKLVETVEIKVECHFYFYYALVGLFSANFFC